MQKQRNNIEKLLLKQHRNESRLISEMLSDELQKMDTLSGLLHSPSAKHRIAFQHQQRLAKALFELVLEGIQFSQNDKSIVSEQHIEKQLALLQQYSQESALIRHFPTVMLLACENVLIQIGLIEPAIKRQHSYNQFLDLLKTLESFFEYHFLQNQLIIIKKSVLLQMNHLSGDFDKSIKNAPTLQDIIIQNAGLKTTQRMSLCYQMAYAYFQEHKIEEALVWLTYMQYTIENDDRKNIHYIMGIMLTWMCHYELGNEKFLKGHIRKGQVLLQKLGVMTEFEMAIILLFSTLLNKPYMEHREAVFQEYLILFEKMPQHPKIKIRNNLLHIPNWLQYQLADCMLAKI